jgi:C4-dicarboxylate-specific signal transduction histidine kinase
VLSNLIGNAVDALGSEGHLHPVIRQREKRVEIAIADNGAGIAVGSPTLCSNRSSPSRVQKELA